MTVFQDAFTRSGALVGSATEAGAGVWAGSAGTSTTSDRAQLPTGTFALLNVGSGDADLTVDVVDGYYAGLMARASGGVSGWRLEGYYQTYSSGSYQTVTSYSAQYYINASYQLPGDTCAQVGSTVYRSQCGNSSFPSSISGNCGSGSTYYANLFAVTAQGTCQVYVPGSYTVYFSRLISPAGVTVWSGQTNYGPTLRLRVQGANVTAWVNGTQVATATDADPASRARSGHGFYAGSSDASFDTFALDTLNVPPNAPIVVAPAQNSVVDRTSAVDLQWQHNDPDAGDRQSKYDLQYRLVGATTWTDVSRETPTSSFTFDAGVLTDGGQYEWQVRTYDAQGVQGPWSATSYFRAGTPPPAPTWVAPTDGGQIPTERFVAQWSSASQVAFQLQVFADRGSAPDGPALYDSGSVTSTRRDLQLTFATNNVTRHLRVRVQAGGLWSRWATVQAAVSYTPPATTRVSVTADDLAGRIFVDLTDPEPTGTQPTVLFHELYRQEGSASEQRVATNLPPNATWIDWTPASGVDQLYRAVAFGDNGVTSTSAPTA